MSVQIHREEHFPRNDIFTNSDSGFLRLPFGILEQEPLRTNETKDGDFSISGYLIYGDEWGRDTRYEFIAAGEIAQHICGIVSGSLIISGHLVKRYPPDTAKYRAEGLVVVTSLQIPTHALPAPSEPALETSEEGSESLR